MDTIARNADTLPGDASSTERRRVYVKTFGCQMNVYDTERMAEVLTTLGYDETAEMERADLVLLNTCHIREKAVEKVYSDLGRIRQVKEERRASGQQTLVAVAGCVAQAQGAEIAARAPVVDLVVGPQSYHRLPELLARAASGTRRIVETTFPEEDKFAELPRRTSKARSAFLTVQEGCDKFCTFCVVPYTRGVEVSRPVAQIEAEARQLVDGGAVEITLLGQNVNGYHGEGPGGTSWSLARLCQRLAGIEGLSRLRYTTSHPRNMTDDLIAAHAEIEKLMPFLHLPFQAGSDRILAAMNRKHTAKEYIDLIARVRQARPDIALSTDIIVGFPGETEADFAETLAVVEAVEFAHAYVFKYSPRPGTPSARLADHVPESVQNDRLMRVQDRLSLQHAKFNAASLGKRLPVLFERAGRSPGWLVGRSPYMQLVTAPAHNQALGRIAEVEVTSVSSQMLSGVVTSNNATTPVHVAG